jgi:hypothetical protein
MVKKINAKDYGFDYQANKGKTPTENDYDTVVDYDCDIYSNGKVVCSYRVLPKEELALLSACTKKAKCTKSSRTLGVNQMSAVYGALPRVALREDYCRFSAQTKAQPEVFNGLKKVGLYLWGVYQSTYPDVAAEFSKFAESIDSDWKKTGTPFTTVNVNKNFAIGYHKDAANYSGVYSNVLISKFNADGGYFVMPQYRIALAQSNGALVIVDGVTIPHGVTHIIPKAKNWERSSVVFYTLSNLQHCLPKVGELLRSKEKTTERARKRATGFDPRQKEKK